MAKTIEQKRANEQKMVSNMIKVYCSHKHKNIDKDENKLCPECAKLNDYAKMKASKCPFMETKTFCSNCKVHCYGKEQQKMIKEVMRFSGPHMLYIHPIAAIRHVYYTIQKKRKKRK